MQFSLHRPVSLLCHRESGDRRRADLCRAADLLLKSGIVSFLPETASSSFITFLLLGAVLALVLHYMTRHALLSVITFAAAEGVLILLYILNSSVYEGLIQSLFNILDITAPFYELSSGLLDLTRIVYYLSVILIFLFLTVQSILKRRWS